MQLFSVTDVRGFMNALLKEDVFHGFEARGITLCTMTTFEIDCIQSGEEEPAGTDERKTGYCRWEELQPTIFELIKGKKPPKLFKLLLSVRAEELEKIHENAAALHLTMKYENSAIQVLTGCAQRKFALDKDVDQAWDAFVMKKLAGMGLE